MNSTQGGAGWLEQLLGEWVFESVGTEDPGQCGGVERFRKLGEYWYIGESEMKMPGGGIGHAILTLGYDPGRNRYVGTWIGSMMSNLWIYDGELDPTGRILSLYSEGPSFDEQGNFSKTERSRYRDAIELNDDGTRTFTGAVQQPDGSWKVFMTMRHKKKS
jgi:hypothetical protein